ncbi:MAG: DUF2188 domain-containing protein [Candidatus Doudnabacteria bacterium]|nr:DUF2188 domain-containing protein [Candidatus Doudnabacteria bacterium]
MRNKIYVLSHGFQWKVRCEHCNYEQITSTQAEAIKLAKQHVARFPAGALSQILIQGQNGQYRAEWTYGKDPYPPRG